MALVWFTEFWGNVCDQYPPGIVEMIVLVTTQLVAFWVPAAIYLSIDLLFPAFSNRHKIQSERRQPSWQQISHCIKAVAANEVVGIALQFIIRHFITGYDKSMFTVEPQLPSLFTIASDFVYGMLAREVSFYYIHRAFHHPKVYAHIHKKHHKFTTPMAFAAQYAHPAEHILANISPILVPLALRRANLLSFALFAGFELWEAAADHSGYDFVKLPPASIHDLHHEKFRVYYSPLGLMDWLHGTDVLGWDKPKGL